ncbi:uncharacterized protein LOC121384490 [Gigantopelta aegis]|uniref:uncharacterized protein LOC121384490 n=1 Tax=Gigantopelta aegis TaxID=1735272 RepID=UPI001B88DAE0|nr:uncharacterized protein LOC121384490 [Gigantopelta aegis]
MPFDPINLFHTKGATASPPKSTWHFKKNCDMVTLVRCAILICACLSALVGPRVCHAQWAQTNGWGGAGVGHGKRAFAKMSTCKPNPSVIQLISLLSKLETQRVRLCEMDILNKYRIR